MARFYTFYQWLAVHPELRKQIFSCECEHCSFLEEEDEPDEGECETLIHLKLEYEATLREQQEAYERAMREV